MERDRVSNDLLDKMVAKADRHADHLRLAINAYVRIKAPRRRELTISRIAQQLKAKLRRKWKEPVIPGLLDDEKRA